MRRSTLVTMGVVLSLGLAGLLLSGATRNTNRGLDLGVPADFPVSRLSKGQEVCQGPIGLENETSLLEFTPAPGGVKGPALEISLVDFDSRRVLSSARIAPEIMTGGPRRTRLDRRVGHRMVDFCIRHAGGGPVEIYGDRSGGGLREAGVLAAHPTLASSEARLDGRDLSADLFVRFPGETRSLLSRAPTMIERLSRFRAPWFGPWIPWLVVGLLVFVAPVALYRALIGAQAEDAAIAPGPRRGPPAA